MDQFDREDSSKYTASSNQQQFEPARQEPAPVPVQQPVKPRKSKAPLVLSLLLIVALLGLGAFGFLWYQQNGRVSDLEADLSSSRNKVTQLETAAKANEAIAENEEEAVVTDTNSDSSDDILQKAIEYSALRTGNQGFVDGTSARQGKIDKQTTEFAKVTVSSPTSAGTETIYLKSSDDGWVVIGDGSENVTTLENSFGLPKGF